MIMIQLDSRQLDVTALGSRGAESFRSGRAEINKVNKPSRRTIPLLAYSNVYYITNKTFAEDGD